MKSASLRLYIRGAFFFEHLNGHEIVVGRKKSKALLALLALSDNGVCNRRWLQDKLWSDRDQKQGGSSLRQELSYLRKLQHKECIKFLEIARDTVRLKFETVAIDVRSKRQSNEARELLEGIDLDDPEFEDWLREKRLIQNEERSTYSNSSIDENGNLKRAFFSRPRLQVSEFDALSDENSLLDFSSGLRDELLISLGTLSENFDVTDNTTNPFDQIAYELSGSVRKNGKLRVTAHLTILPERKTIWSARFDNKDEDFIAIQEDLSRKIVEAIQSRLVDGEMVSIWSRYQTSLDVWELYQEGRRKESLHSPSEHKAARRLYNNALEIDPEFVPAKIVLVFICIDELRLGWENNPLTCLH